MNKKLKYFSFIGIAAIVVTPICMTPYFIKLSRSENNDSPNQSNDDNYLVSSQSSADNNYYQIGDFYYEDLESYDRDICNQYYDSPVWSKYHNIYNFIYPGYNRNYEDGDNKWFGTASDPKLLNGMDAVYNERVPDINVKYSDGTWIKNEIKNGTFKKHHAADNFYDFNFDNIKAIKRHFTIGTNSTGMLGLGLYCPAGEVITIKFDDSTWEYLKNNPGAIKFWINENYNENWPEGDSAQISDRYPFICSEFNLDSSNQELKIGSPFGGALSVYINNLSINNDNFSYKNCLDLNFSVDGAIPDILYQDGYTSNDDWNHYKELAKTNSIAPVIQANSNYFVFNYPQDSHYGFGGVDISNLVFPDKIFKYWNELMFWLNYIAGRTSIIRHDIKATNDIWKWVEAWGTSYQCWIPKWDVFDAFFNETYALDGFTIDAWGPHVVSHELAHGFQFNDALFKRTYHAKNEPANHIAMTAISDTTRWRNELNWSGYRDNSYGNRFQCRSTSYIDIYDILKDGGGEFDIYQLLVWLMGPKNLADYIRYDTVYGSCNDSNWSGAKEIKELSDFTHLNLWPAFENFGKWWRDWPENYNSASATDKSYIDSIQKYPVVDFVGNLYSTGSYIYDSINDNYVYTGDVATPFEIVAGQPKVFKLDDYFISLNTNFKWNDIEFDSTSKLGGKLEYNSSNRTLTYFPNPNCVDQIDEFEITFIPSNFDGKLENYVPGYKFKYKIRQVANGASQKVYLLNGKNITNPIEILNYIDNSKNDYDYLLPYTRLSNEGYSNSYSGSKIEFKFVAPNDGIYQLNASWDDYIRLYANNVLEFQSDYYSQNKMSKIFESTYLKKGQTIDFKIIIANAAGSGNLNLNLTCNNESIDLFDNIIVPNSNELNYSDTQLLSFKYIDRKINYYEFNNFMSNQIYNQYYEFDILDPKQYSLSSPYSDVNDLNNMDYGYFELWNNDNGPNSAKSEFTVNFNEPTVIKSLFFGHRTNNHPNARPTNIVVTGIDENNNEIKLYDGNYPNRSASWTYINLDNDAALKSLHIVGINNNYYGLIWQWFRCSTDSFNPVSNAYSFYNSNIKISKKWQLKSSNNENISAMNNNYLFSNSKNNIIEFNLKNTDGFVIVGQSNNFGAKFDVYIDNKLVDTASAYSYKTIMNNVLYKYYLNKTKDINVKIVTKDNNNLYLNYLMLIGDHAVLVD